MPEAASTEFSKELWPEALVEGGGEIQRHHGPRTELGLEEVGLPELNPFADTGGVGVPLTGRQEGRIDLHTNAACAVIPGRRNHDTAVPAAEVVDDIGRIHRRKGKQAIHHVCSGGKIDDIRPA